jgi:hypothetical protein
MKIIIAMLSLSFAACQADSESALDHAQILAVRAEPANVAPGQRARIDLLAGNDAGDVYTVVPDTLEATSSMGPLVAQRADDGWYITAPAQPDVVSLTVTQSIDGTLWPATKSLVVGEARANPQVSLQIDGQDAAEMVARAGTTPALTAIVDGIAPFTYAWYSSVGDVPHYHQQIAALDASSPKDGAVLLVVRDSLGGVGWQLLPAHIQ